MLNGDVTTKTSAGRLSPPPFGGHTVVGTDFSGEVALLVFKIGAHNIVKALVFGEGKVIGCPDYKGFVHKMTARFPVMLVEADVEIDAGGRKKIAAVLFPGNTAATLSSANFRVIRSGHRDFDGFFECS
jgi:hypothetical protein